MIGFLRAAALWSLGLITALALNKIELNSLPADETSQFDLKDIKTAKKHFLATYVLNMSALAAATFTSVSFIVWILFIGCGMLFAPVFYNVFYVCMPKTKESATRLMLTITSVANIVLIAYSLIYIYFGYINKPFM